MSLRHFELDQFQKETLSAMRDHHPKPYLRVKAAVLLKTAQGIPPAIVARQGILKPLDPDTVYSWLDRYTKEGLAGLYVHSGRGRKPAFFPSQTR